MPNYVSQKGPCMVFFLRGAGSTNEHFGVDCIDEDQLFCCKNVYNIFFFGIYPDKDVFEFRGGGYTEFSCLL